MIARKHFLPKLLIVALAAVAGGCANNPSPKAFYTYCAKYGNDPKCGGVVEPAPVAAAPAPEPVAAAAPASTEKTVACVTPGRRRTLRASASSKR